MAVILLMTVAITIATFVPTMSFLADTPHSQLKVAAFNIKHFGRATMSSSVVVSNIVKILQRYDIVLIQEVRDATGTALKQLQTELNKNGAWSFVASNPIGRTSYKEQYVFFYRDTSISIAGQYLYDDSVHDYFEREPFAIEVRYYSVTKSAFRYVVFLGLHTRPEDTPIELGQLPAVMKTVSGHFSNADSVIAMGDFNADCSYLSNSVRGSLEIFTPISGFKSYVPDTADTTVASTTNCAYDRVISLGNADIRGAQPYNFETALGLSPSDAASVSDHYPIEFSLY